jgi:hypothetical protein
MSLISKMVVIAQDLYADPGIVRAGNSFYPEGQAWQVAADSCVSAVDGEW